MGAHLTWGVIHGFTVIKELMKLNSCFFKEISKELKVDERAESTKKNDKILKSLPNDSESIKYGTTVSLLNADICF